MLEVGTISDRRFDAAHLKPVTIHDPAPRPASEASAQSQAPRGSLTDAMMGYGLMFGGISSLLGAGAMMGAGGGGAAQGLIVGAIGGAAIGAVFGGFVHFFSKPSAVSADG